MRRFEVESKEMFVAVREKNGNLVSRAGELPGKDHGRAGGRNG